MQNKASKIILHEPVLVTIRTGYLLRMIFIKIITLKVYPLYYATLVKMSQYIAKAHRAESEDLQEQPISTAFNLIGKNAPLMAHIIAVALLNNVMLISIFHRLLAKYLLSRLKPEELELLWVTILESSNVQAFIRTIDSLDVLNVLKPKKETSPSGTMATTVPGE